MTKTERATIQKVCDQYIRILDELAPLTVRFTKKHKRMKTVVDQLLKAHHRDGGERYPDRFFDSLAGTYAFACCFSNPKVIDKILGDDSYELKASHQGALENWRQTPMRWSRFQIDETLGDQLFSIYEDGTEEILTLYSPALERLQKHRQTRDLTYVTLLAFNGSCWQTYGQIHFYCSLELEDITEWMQVLDPASDENMSFTEFVQSHLISFFRLDEISAIPTVQHRGENLYELWSSLAFEQFDPDALLGSWDIEEREERYVRLSYKGMSAVELEAFEIDDEYYGMFGKSEQEFWDPETMRFPTLYFDRKEHLLLMHAMTESGFEVLCNILDTCFDAFDEQMWDPQWHLALPLVSLVDRCDDVSFPWDPIKSLFGEPDEVAKDEDGLDMTKMNALLERMMEAHNEGTEFNLEEARGEFGLSEKDILGIQESVNGIFSKRIKEFQVPEEEQQYCISYPVPPPAQRRAFFEPITDEPQLFSVFEDLESEQLFSTMTANSYRREVELSSVAGHIENLFVEAFGDDEGVTIMNTMFFILLHSGSEYLPVRSYAWEIMKLFGHVLLPDLGITTEEFIAKFSRFTLKKLCTNAICEVASRPSAEAVRQGTYGIRRTVFLEVLLELQ